MPRHIRDGQPTDPKMGFDETVVTHSGIGDKGRSDEGLEVASREAARVAVLVKKLMFCYAAGQTRRWHAMEHMIREETIAAHTWNVVMWIMLLHPEPSKHLIFAALIHDVPEKVTGDMPRWIKQNPAMKAMMAQFETKVLEQWDLPVLADLESEDKRWLEAVDLFDAWLFLRQNLLAGNKLVADSYQRATFALAEMDAPKEVKDIFNVLRWEK